MIIPWTNLESNDGIGVWKTTKVYIGFCGPLYNFDFLDVLWVWGECKKCVRGAWCVAKCLEKSAQLGKQTNSVYSLDRFRWKGVWQLQGRIPDTLTYSFVSLDDSSTLHIAPNSIMFPRIILLCAMWSVEETSRLTAEYVNVSGILPWKCQTLFQRNRSSAYTLFVCFPSCADFSKHLAKHSAPRTHFLQHPPKH